MLKCVQWIIKTDVETDLIEFMEWLIILMLLLVGAILIILEILVFPGVGVSGILGFASVIAGIYFGYIFYGQPTGHLILLGTAVGGLGMTWYILRTKTWKKMSLDTEIASTVEGVDSSVREGDEGETLGRLAPMGNVKVGDVVAEAESLTGYIDAHQKVEVVKVFKNKIVVKLKSV